MQNECLNFRRLNTTVLIEASLISLMALIAKNGIIAQQMIPPSKIFVMLQKYIAPLLLYFAPIIKIRSVMAPRAKVIVTAIESKRCT